jgi:hypothetical protein
MHFWIHIEFTNILGQFTPKKIFIDLFMKYYFIYIVNFIFVNYNNLFEYIIE